MKVFCCLVATCVVLASIPAASAGWFDFGFLGHTFANSIDESKGKGKGPYASVVSRCLYYITENNVKYNMYNSTIKQDIAAYWNEKKPEVAKILDAYKDSRNENDKKGMKAGLKKLDTFWDDVWVHLYGELNIAHTSFRIASPKQRASKKESFLECLHPKKW